MDIRRLRYFVAAAEEENLHRAAERLHVVQPALSKQIATLEAELGCALFVRANGRMYLTPAGQQYLIDVRQILRDVQRAKERALQTSAGQIGVLRVGFRETAGRSQIVSRSLSEFRSNHPGVELRLNQKTSPSQCDALRAGELDVGFVYLSHAHDYALEHLALTKDHFYLALHNTHPLASRKRIQLRDLTDESFIWLARSRNAYYSDALLRDCINNGLTPKVIQEADSDATALNLVAVGMGVSFVVSAQADSPLPDVILKPVVELNQALTLALAWSPTATAAPTLNFVATVKKIKTALK